MSKSGLDSRQFRPGGLEEEDLALGFLTLEYRMDPEAAEVWAVLQPAEEAILALNESIETLIIANQQTDNNTGVPGPPISTLTGLRLLIELRLQVAAMHLRRLLPFIEEGSPFGTVDLGGGRLAVEEFADMGEDYLRARRYWQNAWGNI